VSGVETSIVAAWLGLWLEAEQNLKAEVSRRFRSLLPLCTSISSHSRSTSIQPRPNSVHVGSNNYLLKT
jgi:hypothetical protein